MRELTEEQWKAVEIHVGVALYAGHHVDQRREVLEAVLRWVRTGLWLTERPCPSVHTCRRRMREWAEGGAFALVINELADDLQERGAARRFWSDSWEFRTVSLLLSPRLVRILAAHASIPRSSPRAIAVMLIERAASQHPEECS